MNAIISDMHNWSVHSAASLLSQTGHQQHLSLTYILSFQLLIILLSVLLKFFLNYCLFLNNFLIFITHVNGAILVFLDVIKCSLVLFMVHKWDA